MTLFDTELPADSKPRRPIGRTIGISAGAVALAALGLFAVMPSPYVIQVPGPTFDALGEVDTGEEVIPLITITGTETYETSGELNVLTVSMRGNPDQPLSWLETGLAWFTPGAVLLPMESVFPDDITTEEREEQDAAAMSSSQLDAVAAALTELQIPFETTLSVGVVLEDTPAEGVFEEGDIIHAVNGEPVSNVDQIRQLVAEGEGSPVTISVTRAGAPTELTLTPVLQDENWIMGVGVEADYVFPFDVTIFIDNVGGPSGGTIFTLGIIDQLTEGELTGGEVWAGTGTITAGGAVGPIGGIEQKMYGALNAGAKYMFAPIENCDEVVGNIPDGLEVFAVSTLHEAKLVLEGVASGQISSQPRCEGN